MRFCPGMYLAVSVDRSSDRHLRKLVKCLTDNGRRLTVAQLRRRCAEERAKGRKVFPKDGCDNPGTDGQCAGHPDGEEEPTA